MKKTPIRLLECIIKGCNHQVAFGLCRKHYNQEYYCKKTRPNKKNKPQEKKWKLIEIQGLEHQLIKYNQTYRLASNLQVRIEWHKKIIELQNRIEQKRRELGLFD